MQSLAACNSGGNIFVGAFDRQCRPPRPERACPALDLAQQALDRLGQRLVVPRRQECAQLAGADGRRKCPGC